MPLYLLYIFYGIQLLKLSPPKRLFIAYDFNYLLISLVFIIKIDLTITKYNLYNHSDYFIFLKFVFFHWKKTVYELISEVNPL